MLSLFTIALVVGVVSVIGSYALEGRSFTAAGRGVAGARGSPGLRELR